MFQEDNIRPHRQLSLLNIKCRLFWSQEIRHYYNLIQFSERRKQKIVNECIQNMNIFNVGWDIPYYFYLYSFEAGLF